MPKRYATLDEARNLVTGATGDTRLIDDVLIERLEGDAVECWIAWHHLDQSGSWDLVSEADAASLTGTNVTRN